MTTELGLPRGELSITSTWDLPGVWKQHHGDSECRRSCLARLLPLPLCREVTSLPPTA